MFEFGNLKKKSGKVRNKEFRVLYERGGRKSQKASNDNLVNLLPRTFHTFISSINHKLNKKLQGKKSFEKYWNIYCKA